MLSQRKLFRIDVAEFFPRAAVFCFVSFSYRAVDAMQRICRKFYKYHFSIETIKKFKNNIHRWPHA